MCVWGHTLLCSGYTTGSVLRYQSWQCSRIDNVFWGVKQSCLCARQISSSWYYCSGPDLFSFSFYSTKIEACSFVSWTFFPLVFIACGVLIVINSVESLWEIERKNVNFFYLNNFLSFETVYYYWLMLWVAETYSFPIKKILWICFSKKLFIFFEGGIYHWIGYV